MDSLIRVIVTFVVSVGLAVVSEAIAYAGVLAWPTWVGAYTTSLIMGWTFLGVFLLSFIVVYWKIADLLEDF